MDSTPRDFDQSSEVKTLCRNLLCKITMIVGILQSVDQKEDEAMTYRHISNGRGISQATSTEFPLRVPTADHRCLLRFRCSSATATLSLHISVVHFVFQTNLNTQIVGDPSYSLFYIFKFLKQILLLLYIN